MNPPITWMRLQRDGLPPTLLKVGQKSADFWRISVHFVNDLLNTCHCSEVKTSRSQLPNCRSVAFKLFACKTRGICFWIGRFLKSLGTLYIQASNIISDGMIRNLQLQKLCGFSRSSILRSLKSQWIVTKVLCFWSHMTERFWMSCIVPKFLKSLRLGRTVRY